MEEFTHEELRFIRECIEIAAKEGFYSCTTNDTERVGRAVLSKMGASEYDINQTMKGY